MEGSGDTERNAKWKAIIEASKENDRTKYDQLVKGEKSDDVDPNTEAALREMRNNPKANTTHSAETAEKYE